MNTPPVVENEQANSAFNFLEGGGEMGQLIRSIDWSATPIGGPSTWPQCLRTSISLVLSSYFPMYIAWGNDYIQLYNDGYRPILGSTKHPRAMGISTRETFAEIWDTIGGMFEGVMNGKAVGFPDFILHLDRNGYIEECHFDFCYSPIKYDDGTVGGVLVTVVETTEKYNAFSSLQHAKTELEISQAETAKQRDRLNRFFMQAPAGICVLDGPQLVFELVNPSYQRLLPGRNLLGRPMFEALPELKSGRIHDMLEYVYNTGKAFEGKEVLTTVARHEGGPLEDRYFNFIYEPRLDANNAVDGIMVFVFEITEIVKAKSKIEESEKQFRFMLNAIPQQVWTATPAGELDYVNDVVCADFGHSYEDILGAGWQKFIHPDDLPGCLEKWIEALTTGNEYAVEFRLLMMCGQYIWHLGRAVPLIEAGEIILWVGTNTNIDLQKNNEHKKDEFLSIASHELKTPITTLKASVQILQKIMQSGTNTDMMPLFINKANANLDKLVDLLDDLMNVSKIQQGQLALNKAEFNMMELLNDCCEHVRLVGSHELKITGDDNLMVYADYKRIDQVIVNFVNNAVKYAPESNRIEINFEHDARFVKVSVRDYGIGIGSEKIPYLFDRYYRVDSTGVQFSGLGLGLYISAEIIKRHGGEIGVESEPGKGSTFWFTLPLDSTPKNRKTA